MNKSIFKGYKAKALAIAVSAITEGLVVTPALYAQDQVEEIQVTGSRVRVTDGMAAPTPVTAYLELLIGPNPETSGATKWPFYLTLHSNNWLQ